jgi:hypothetical protein
MYVLGSSLSNANTPLPPPLAPIPGRFLSHDDLAVVKLAPDGTVLWSLTYDFPTLGDTNLTPQTQSGHDVPLEGVLGADGSLYVLSQMTYRYDTVIINIGNPPQPTETTIPAYGLGIVKISSSGSVTWTTIHFPPGVVSMSPISMAMGDSGRLYAAYVANATGGGQTQGVLVVESAGGTTVTDLRVNAGGASAFTLPRVVRRGTGGRIYVASTPPTSAGSSALLTVIDDATASIVRETFATGAVSRGVEGMAVSPVTGDVAIGGTVDGPGGGDAMVAKFSASGDHLWTSAFNDGNNSSQRVVAGIAMDAAGNVYTAGIQGIAPSPNDIFVVKFAAGGGAPAWGRVWSMGATVSEFVTGRQGIVVRPAGEVVVSGWVPGEVPGSDFDMLALPLNADTGEVGTPIIYDAAISSASDDRVSGGLLVAPDGGVVLAGRASTARNMDFAVVKFGGSVPCPSCVADFNQDGGVDGADIASFFPEWEASASCADVNLDGGVDGGDIEAFFLVWQEGGC